MGGQLNVWSLKGRLSQNESMQEVTISSSPFRIGRRSDMSLTLTYPAVSNLHAEILTDGDSLSIRDLDSTNGTFVNGVRITSELPLQAGDLIQFADVTVRLQQREEAATSSPIIRPGIQPEGQDAESQFDALLTMRSIIPFYQPIISLRDKKLVGNEVLARSRIDGLRTPREMFLVASQRNLEEELSRVLRLACLEHAATPGPILFLNTHPSEIDSFGLLRSLQKFRELNLNAPITFEIREPNAADTERLTQLRSALSDLGIGLAYDNFGSGQSRRLELATVRPEFVKFDMNLIRDIHLAPITQQTMLANLISMVHELGIASIAVGVESEAEHNVCCEIGFEYGQGFFYGKPTSTESNLLTMV